MQVMLGEISITTVRYADDTTLMAESEEELKKQWLTLFLGAPKSLQMVT